MKRSELFSPRCFFSVPIWLSVIPSHVLSPSAKLLWCAIADHLGRNGKAWPGQKTLATLTGLNMDRVNTDIRRLRILGLVEITRTSTGNEYVLMMPECLQKLATEIASQIAQNDGKIDREPIQEILKSWIDENGSKRFQENLKRPIQEILKSANSGSPEVATSGNPELPLQEVLNCTSKDRTNSGTNSLNQPSAEARQAIIPGCEPSRKTLAKIPEIPGPLDTPEFQVAWENWRKHRAEIKKRLTPTSVKEQFEKLSVMGIKRAIAAINHSIAQGWTGIFEPANKGSDHGKPTTANLANTRRDAKSAAAAATEYDGGLDFAH